MRLLGGTGHQFDIIRIMDQLDFLARGVARFDVDKMPRHIRLLKHGIDGFQPEGTFRMEPFYPVTQITPVSDNTCSSQKIAFLPPAEFRSEFLS